MSAPFAGLARVGEVMDVSGEPLAEVALVADAFRAPGRSLLMPPFDRPLDPGTVLDISHESLIRQWQALKDWARAEASSAEQYRDTERRARRWASGAAGLWEGIDLDLGLAWRERDRPSAAWAARYGGDFELAMRFLNESRAHRDAMEADRRNTERRQRQQQQRKFAVSVIIIAVVSILAAGLGWESWFAHTESSRAESVILLTGRNSAPEILRPLSQLEPGMSEKLANESENLSREIEKLQAELLPRDEPSSRELLRGIAVYVFIIAEKLLAKDPIEQGKKAAEQARQIMICLTPIAEILIISATFPAGTRGSARHCPASTAMKMPSSFMTRVSRSGKR